jgi:hypothetical protein
MLEDLPLPLQGPGVPFPDSITAGRGLPPRATDANTRVLGGDTLIVSQLFAHPAYSVAPGQVPPGAPTSGPMRISLRVFARDTSTSTLRDRPLDLAACPVRLRLYRTADRSGAPVWRSEAAAPAAACPTPRWYRPNDVTLEWAVPAILGDSLAAGRYYFAHTVRLADGRVLEYRTGDAYLSLEAAPSRDLRALRIAARSEVVGQAPRSLRTTVVVVNTGTRTVQFEHGACTPVLRLYRTADRSGPPVWRSEYRRPAGVPNTSYACPDILLGKVLPPGDSAMFTATVPLAEVLADSLSAGTYAVGAELELLNDDLPPNRWRTVHRLDAGVVALPRSPDPLPISRTVNGLTYVATTRLIRGATPATDTVRTLVLVTNHTAARVEAEATRDCPVIAYAYRSVAVRDSFPVQNPAWRASVGCAIIPHRFALAPGESWVFAHEVAAAEIVARTGAGHYWFTARLPGTPGVTLAAGNVELR